MKFLFSLAFVVNSLFGAMDPNGWVSVERPKKNSFEEVLQEEDSTIWVVFAKELGAEKFLVRFPHDPQYTYLTSGEMEISSTQGNQSYRLQVLKADPSFLEERKQQVLNTLLIEAKETDPNTLDLFYQSEGKWIWERLLMTPHHLYFFQTTSDVPIREGHQQFVDSLDIETQ